MPTQIASPIPIPIPAPRQESPTLSLITSQDFYASLNATLASKSNQLVTPVSTTEENDYFVPAAPPPSPIGSPVSFRDNWPQSIRR